MDTYDDMVCVLFGHIENQLTQHITGISKLDQRIFTKIVLIVTRTGYKVIIMSVHKRVV